MLSVSSEYGVLKRAVVHRPGKELDRLTIENKDNFLFDDILWLEEAQKDFDSFLQVCIKKKWRCTFSKTFWKIFSVPRPFGGKFSKKPWLWKLLIVGLPPIFRDTALSFPPGNSSGYSWRELQKRRSSPDLLTFEVSVST